MSLFGRRVELIVERPTGISLADGSIATEGVKIVDLNIDFDITADRSAGPNEMVCTVYGANEDTRYRLRRVRGALATLRFGYSGDQMVTLFKGNLRSSIVRKENEEIVVEIEAADGERAHFPRFKKSYRRNWPVINILNELVAVMEIDPGNLASFTELAEEGGLSTTLERPIRLQGHAIDHLARLLGSRGIEWSIQQNKLQLLKYGEAFNDGSAIPVLAPGSGLIGVPAINNEGIVTADCLIQPYITPGRLADIQSRFLGDRQNLTTTKSRYKILRCSYRGSLYSDSMIRLEGKKRVAA